MPFGVGKANYNSTLPKNNGAFTLQSARVLAVILDDKNYPEVFKAQGEWGAIGGIVFEFSETPTGNQKLAQQPFALPLFPNLKNYPVKNEIVSILVTADTGINENTTSFTYYYLPPTNVWTSNHHNAIPDEINSTQGLQPSQKKDYIQVGAGSIRRVTDGSTEIDFDNGFKERLDIKPLAPYIGDVTIEGRWGNSLRIGSTNRSSLPNTWSQVGEEGDPIVILRNGQFESNTAPWIPQSENLTTDKSSVYLTSTQKLSFPTNVKYNTTSFNNVKVPTVPNEYTNPQAIITSERVGLFGRSETIINTPLTHINTQQFNLDATGTVTLIGSRINLNSGNAAELEPVLKGAETGVLLTDLLVNLTAFMTAIQLAKVPGLEGVKVAAGQFIPKLNQLITDINTPGKIKSTKTFTS